LDSDLDGVADFVTDDTKVRRMILSILASKLTDKLNKSRQFHSAKTGPPKLTCVHKKEGWTQHFNFVDGIEKFGKIIKNEDLKEVYNFVNAHSYSKSSYQQFLVLNA
jgi:hypothetical protein